jgi:hypothetical protein
MAVDAIVVGGQAYRFEYAEHGLKIAPDRVAVHWAIIIIF